MVFDNVHNFEEAIRRLKAELERYPEGGNDKERAIIELIEAVHKKAYHNRNSRISFS